MFSDPLTPSIPVYWRLLLVCVEPLVRRRDLTAAVEFIVQKKGLGVNEESQAMEDAACLVFLEVRPAPWPAVSLFPAGRPPRAHPSFPEPRPRRTGWGEQVYRAVGGEGRGLHCEYLPEDVGQDE